LNEEGPPNVQQLGATPVLMIGGMRVPSCAHYTNQSNAVHDHTQIREEDEEEEIAREPSLAHGLHNGKAAQQQQQQAPKLARVGV
jgi:hypothetical protein